MSIIALLSWVCNKSEKYQRSKLSSVDCNAIITGGFSAYILVFFQLTLKGLAFWSPLFWIFKKVCKKGDLCKKNSGSHSFLNKYYPMRILCRFPSGMNILMILTANCLIFFIQFNSEVKVKGHGGIFRYQRLEYGVMYICTKFQPDITTNMEVILKFSLATLSSQKSAKKIWFFFM